MCPSMQLDLGNCSLRVLITVGVFSYPIGQGKFFGSVLQYASREERQPRIEAAVIGSMNKATAEGMSWPQTW